MLRAWYQIAYLLFSASVLICMIGSMGGYVILSMKTGIVLVLLFVLLLAIVTFAPKLVFSSPPPLKPPLIREQLDDCLARLEELREALEQIHSTGFKQTEGVQALKESLNVAKQILEGEKAKELALLAENERKRTQHQLTQLENQ